MNATTMNQLTLESNTRNNLPGFIEGLARTLKVLETWRQRQKSRAQFARTDSRILRDTGIDQTHRFIESNKPFWEE